MPTVSLKQTKSVIFNAYKEAIAEAKRLQSEVTKANLALSRSKTAHDKAIQQLNTAKKAVKANTVKAVPPKEVIKVVTKIGDMSNLDGVIGALNTIQESIGTAISQCANMQVIEAEKLEVLQKEIKDCQTQLKELYDIDFGDDTLQTLVEDYETTKEAFSEEFDEQQRIFEETLAEKTKNWQKEQLLQSAKTLENKDIDKIEKEREQTEYHYQLNLERNLEADNYAQKHKKLQQELAETRETKQEEFATREKAVKEREIEFADYKKKYNELPKRLEKTIKEAEHVGKAVIERDAKIKMNLFKKEVENETNANNLKIKSLNSFIEKQEAQIKHLTDQLEKAMKQAQTLAVKAIEGTAHAESFDAMKAIAMEQAKYSTKSK